MIILEFLRLEIKKGTMFFMQRPHIFELSKQEKQEVITNCDNLLSDEIKFSPKPPKAFTEKTLDALLR